ncbi:MAG: adenylosuccinate synthetase, partial [Proteobacteria bacterium]|nr:adenylosuccinate synthetase [Pseudomonadota bacterium]
KKLKIATGYRVEGVEYGYMPDNIRKARMAAPVYEEMDGWDTELPQIRSYEDLPAQAKTYLKRLEDLTGVAPAIVSVGPDREETLLLRNPFAG